MSEKVFEYIKCKFCDNFATELYGVCFGKDCIRKNFQTEEYYLANVKGDPELSCLTCKMPRCYTCTLCHNIDCSEAVENVHA